MLELKNGTIEELINSIVEFITEVYNAVMSAFTITPGYKNKENWPAER